MNERVLKEVKNRASPSRRRRAELDLKSRRIHPADIHLHLVPFKALL